METGMFEIHDVESLRAHYALTLRHWVKRLEEHAAEAHDLLPASAYRVWRLYMAGCAWDFETGDLGVYQVLAAKRQPGQLAVPLTRSFMAAKGASATPAL
jgi:cyclopropane-fatty-acyl-phospholipid synthase